MNPKRCMKCLVHGFSSTHCSDECAHSNCDCRKCKLIDLRREVTSKLVRISTKQKINLNIEDDSDTRYMCSKCRHHGFDTIKKYHSCPFAACKCKLCDLNEERRRIDSELGTIQNTEKSIYSLPFNSIDCASDDGPDFNNNRLSPDAKVILDLIHVLSVDPSSFNPDNFDYHALSNFFNKETIVVPDEWLPQLPNMFELVHEALKRFPILKEVHFQTGFNCIAVRGLNID